MFSVGDHNVQIMEPSAGSGSLCYVYTQHMACQITVNCSRLVLLGGSSVCIDARGGGGRGVCGCVAG